MPAMKHGTAYNLDGPADAPVVVLIHGLGLTRESTWAGFIPHLADRFRVLSYDLLGHGQSELPDGDVDLASLSEQLIALMDGLEIGRAALVGFSLGGMINRRCAMDHPDRVTALVVLNSPHDRGAQQQALVEKRADDTAAGGPAANLAETLARWFTPDFRKSHPETVEWIRQVVLANHPGNYAAHRRVLARGIRELIRPDPPIRHPALVMTCENDSGSSPEMSHAIATEIDDAEVLILSGLQHLGLIEEPDRFSDPVGAFLRRILDSDEKDTR